MAIYDKIYLIFTFSLVLVFNHDFVIYTDIARQAASTLDLAAPRQGCVPPSVSI